MHFDIQDIILIDTIDRAGSFSSAADLLYRTRSAITQHVKKLEDQLGFQIFDRTTYRPTLTYQGRYFLAGGRPLLQGLNRLKTDLKQVHEGWESEFSLAIDDVMSFEALLTLMHEFRKVAPQVNLRISREVLNGCWDALLENRATLAIGAGGEPPPTLLCDQMTLGNIEFVYAVARDHPLTQLPRYINPEDLEPYPSIVVSDTSRGLLKRTTGYGERQTQITVPTMDAKIEAQRLGIGVGYLPKPRIREYLKSGELVTLTLMAHAKRKSHYNIAWHVGSKSPTLRWFLKALDSPNVKQSLLGEG
jgi:DNA-binding transcriptional LysR family regulator